MDDEALAAILGDAGEVVMSQVLANAAVVTALTDAGVDADEMVLMASLSEGGPSSEGDDSEAGTGDNSASAACRNPSVLAFALAAAVAFASF